MWHFHSCLIRIKNSLNLTIFGNFNKLLSTLNVKVARSAGNVEWDFFWDFQTPCANANKNLSPDFYNSRTQNNPAIKSHFPVTRTGRWKNSSLLLCREDISVSIKNSLKGIPDVQQESLWRCCQRLLAALLLAEN